VFPRRDPLKFSRFRKLPRSVRRLQGIPREVSPQNLPKSSDRHFTRNLPKSSDTESRDKFLTSFGMESRDKFRPSITGNIPKSSATESPGKVLTQNLQNNF
jgi:hypothetical protein